MGEQEASRSGSANPASQRQETRREQLAQRRLERQEELAAQARAQRIQRVALRGGVVLVTALVVGLIFRGITTAPPATIDGVVTYANLARDHTASPVTYPQSPPVGGPHNPAPQTCGIYEKPIANENAVHSLEHGAVWITYQPNLPTDAVERLRSLTRGHNHVLLSPYPDLPTAVVASSWGLQLKAQSTTDLHLRQFVMKYEGGSQAPESGAPCAGVGTPLK